LVESLGGRSPAWSTPARNTWATGYGPARRPSQFSEFAGQHYNYEDESQESHRPAAANDKGMGTGNREFGTIARTSSSKPFVASWMTAGAKTPSSSQRTSPALPSHKSSPKGETQEAPEAHSIDNIARFFGGKAVGGKAGLGKPGAFPRPASSRPPMEIPASAGAAGLRKGQRVRHSKYGEGTVLMREGDGEDAKLTVLFSSHGMKKLMEKFANLQKL
jgi:hypothetical protein